MINLTGKYTVFPTVFGWVGLAASNEGLYASVLPKLNREDAASELLAKILNSRNPFSPELDINHFAEAEAKVKDYFLGNSPKLNWKIDWSWATPFQRRVLGEVLGLPSGTVATYGDIAKRIGAPSSARAVGGALAENFIPVIIPCHRVIGANGKLGGFTGAELGLKAALIELEKNKC